jgi:flagellar basal-body rod protein FlgC
VFERAGAVGVQVREIVEDQTPFRQRFEPSHPDADANGFVSMPNVDVPEEMIDMLGAARAYQANLTAIGLIRDTMNRALDLG